MAQPNNAPVPVVLVTMLRDFVTDVGGLGRRTYREGLTYNACEFTLAAMREAKCAEESLSFYHQTKRPVFDTIAVMPLVSRWFTSDGLDTWHVERGKKAKVPSNLAAFLLEAGYAEAA